MAANAVAPRSQKSARGAATGPLQGRHRADERPECRDGDGLFSEPARCLEEADGSALIDLLVLEGKNVVVMEPGAPSALMIDKLAQRRIEIATGMVVA
jgi:hypothetical protein